MTSRRAVLQLLGAVSIAASARALAQDTRRIPRVGMLSLSAGELLEPVREGLRALGYAEGRNIRLEERVAGDQYEKLAAIAEELVRLPVDLIVTSGATATSAARRATSTIPIVMIAGVDPVKEGYAASLARPGGNVTGLSVYTGGGELVAKRFELAKELIPRLSRVGVLINPASGPATAVRSSSESAARDLKLELRIFEVHLAEHFEQAFDKAARAGVQLIIVPPSSMFNANQTRIIDLAAKARIPGIYGSGQWVERGGLASYGSDITKARQEAARYIDRILRGAKPGDIPIEQPKTVELILNLKTARALGLKIPDVVLLRADKVIE